MFYCEESMARVPLRLDAFQRQARFADQNKKRGSEGLRAPLLGLFGEAGSLLTQLKRRQREKATYTPYYASVVEELGDVLWYLSNLAWRNQVRLSELARMRVTGGIQGKQPKRRPSLSFGDLQRGRKRQSLKVTKHAEDGFFSLGGVIGRLMNDYADGGSHGLKRIEYLVHLAHTFRLLVEAANIAGISLTLVGHNNIAKTASRWPKKKTRKFHELFDNACERDEQLPRRIVIHFDEKRINGKTYVVQQCRGINIGDRLTDNKAKKDDYRFHDVFHLAYAAILGWSPVTRALFQVKRKRDPDIDENQDGARAILIEEGIATWIFNHAGGANKDFRDTKDLDYSLLKAIRQMVSGYEVESCPLWQWQLAILEGFSVFRKLKANRRGWVIADMKRRTIVYRQSRPSYS